MTGKRIALVVVGLVLLGAGLWFAFGRATQTAEQRITADLTARGLPPALAACMGRELTQRLSLPQLAKLDRLKPEPGEPDVPLTAAGLLERLRRVDDPQVVETASVTAAVCTLQHGL